MDGDGLDGEAFRLSAMRTRNAAEETEIAVELIVADPPGSAAA